MSVRHEVAAALKTRFAPKSYTYITSHRGLGTITKPTIAIAHKEFEHGALDGGKTLVAKFVLLIAATERDVDHAEDALDVQVAELLAWFDGPSSPRSMKWTAARRGNEGDVHGWDIDLDVLCEITTDTPTTT